MSDDFRNQLDDLITQAKRDFSDPNADFAAVAGVANVLDRYMAARADLHRLGAAVHAIRTVHAPPTPLSGEDQVEQEWQQLRQGAPR